MDFRSLTAVMVLMVLGWVGCAPHRVVPVATRAERVTDPDYVELFQNHGERELSDRRYVDAWSEFAALGDLAALRRVFLAHAADVERFEARIAASMLQEYQRAAERQEFEDPERDPLLPLVDPLNEIVGAHLASHDARRASMACTLRIELLVRLRKIEDRRVVYAELIEQTTVLAQSSEPALQAVATQVRQDLARVERDHLGRLSE
jgi:hypothetical protein